MANSVAGVPRVTAQAQSLRARTRGHARGGVRDGLLGGQASDSVLVGSVAAQAQIAETNAGVTSTAGSPPLRAHTRRLVLMERAVVRDVQVDLVWGVALGEIGVVREGRTGEVESVGCLSEPLP